MKIVFMGTPDFAVPSLHALTEAGYAVAAVVTQPDKPKGRGKTLLPTPVKEEAVMHDIPVYQPEKVRNNPEFLEILKEINPEIIVVAAYGQIIPKRNPGASEIWMYQYSCVSSSEIQRSSAYPAGCDRRGKSIRCNDPADGRRS